MWWQGNELYQSQIYSVKWSWNLLKPSPLATEMSSEIKRGVLRAYIRDFFLQLPYLVNRKILQTLLPWTFYLHYMKYRVTTAKLLRVQKYSSTLCLILKASEGECVALWASVLLCPLAMFIDCIFNPRSRMNRTRSKDVEGYGSRKQLMLKRVHFVVENSVLYNQIGLHWILKWLLTMWNRTVGWVLGSSQLHKAINVHKVIFVTRNIGTHWTKFWYKNNLFLTYVAPGEKRETKQKCVGTVAP